MESTGARSRVPETGTGRLSEAGNWSSMTDASKRMATFRKTYEYLADLKQGKPNSPRSVIAGLEHVPG